MDIYKLLNDYLRKKGLNEYQASQKASACLEYGLANRETLYDSLLEVLDRDSGGNLMVVIENWLKRNRNNLPYPCNTLPM